MGLSLPASPWLGRAPNNLVPFKGSVELKLSLFVMYCINLNSVLHDVTVHGIVISHTQTLVKYTIQVCVCACLRSCTLLHSIPSCVSQPRTLP